MIFQSFYQTLLSYSLHKCKRAAKGSAYPWTMGSSKFDVPEAMVHGSAERFSETRSLFRSACTCVTNKQTEHMTSFITNIILYMYIYILDSILYIICYNYILYIIYYILYIIYYILYIIYYILYIIFYI